MELTTAERLESLERFAHGQALVMREHGTESMRLDQAEVIAFEKAKKTGFLVRKGKMPRVYEIWHAWCRTTQQPFVAINCRRRRAFIEFELRDRAVELSEEGMSLMTKALRDFSPNGVTVSYGVDRRACTHTGVPIATVEEMARELLRIAKAHTRPVPVTS